MIMLFVLWTFTRLGYYSYNKKGNTLCCVWKDLTVSLDHRQREDLGLGGNMIESILEEFSLKWLVS